MSDDGYRPLSRRQVRWIALVAVATAVGIVLLMLDPPGGVKRQRLLPADVPACAAGQTGGCVGGKVDVIVPAAPAASSRP
jgi:hypothetical protein